MNQAQHDLLVIGGGPAGYIAAIRGAQLGLNVGCVELEPALGGTCLRVGCIPSKSLLEASQKFAETKSHLGQMGIKVGSVELDLPQMLKRKEEVVNILTSGVAGLFKKHKITRYAGTGRLEGPGRVIVSGADGETTLEAKHIIIATGSKSAQLRGIEVDGDRIVTSTEALSFPSVPEHLVVIGGGYIGLEMGSVWLRLGSKVTVLEYFDRILPIMDKELASDAFRLFKKQGFDFKLKTKVLSARVEGDKCVVECEGQEPVIADRVLLAVGRVPNTEGLNLASVGIELDKGGRIPVDDSFATSVSGLYAIGDVIRGPMLAHKAMEEGVACVEKIVTGYGHVNYDVIPGIVYTHPEIASVGKTEEELKEGGIEFRKGTYPFQANGRARTINDTDGRVKILADSTTDRVLGVHIIGPHAGDMIAEAVAAMEFGASSEDLTRICHAHPTLSEAMHEAALAVDGRPLHI